MGNGADTLQLLHTFARIADAGSLSAAARTLGISQASASRQLAALEGRLGTSLARRSTHDLTLTAEGARLLPRARRLLSDWEAAREDLAAGDAAPTGLLRVVAPTGFGPLVVAPAAARFTRRYPEVDVDLVFTNAPVDLVGLGADMQLKVGPVEGQDLMARRIGEVRRWLVASPDLDLRAHVTEDGEVRDGLPIVALSPFYDSLLVLTDGRGRQVSVTGRVRVRSNVLFAAYQAVLAGGGAGLLPVWLIAPDVAAGRLVRVTPNTDAATVPIHLVYPPGRFRAARTRLFAEMIEAEIKAVV